MKVLVINCGSSSIKYQLFRAADRAVLAAGLLERIGEGDSRLVHRTRLDDGSHDEIVRTDAVPDHRKGFQSVNDLLAQTNAIADHRDLLAIGHRVVHGGERFQQPTLIDDQVLATVRELSPLAPLHNPANIVGIEVARSECPGTPQVAVFDTAFHQSMPRHAYHYAIPHDLYNQYGIRRYGFHGTSCSYVARRAAGLIQLPEDQVNLIVLHLGNGASATAIRAGRSVDTSMGLTPLEGLMMGTRSGDIDPAVTFHLSREAGLSIDQLDTLLNKQSGMKGICGENDMRAVMQLVADGDPHARLAVDMYTYRIQKYVGAYTAALGRVDAVVFTGGIGEHAVDIRHRICQGLEPLGMIIDTRKNSADRSGERAIHHTDSRTQLLVIPTDEEWEIAEQTIRCVDDKRGRSQYCSAQ